MVTAGPNRLLRGTLSDQRYGDGATADTADLRGFAKACGVAGFVVQMYELSDGEAVVYVARSDEDVGEMTFARRQM